MGFRVQGVVFRAQGLRFRIQVLGFRVQGSGFRVQGSGASNTVRASPGSCVHARGVALGVNGLRGSRGLGFRI